MSHYNDTHDQEQRAIGPADVSEATSRGFDPMRNDESRCAAGASNGELGTVQTVNASVIIDPNPSTETTFQHGLGVEAFVEGVLASAERSRNGEDVPVVVLDSLTPIEESTPSDDVELERREFLTGIEGAIPEGGLKAGDMLVYSGKNPSLDRPVPHGATITNLETGESVPLSAAISGYGSALLNHSDLNKDVPMPTLGTNFADLVPDSTVVPAYIADALLSEEATVELAEALPQISVGAPTLEPHVIVHEGVAVSFREGHWCLNASINGAEPSWVAFNQLKEAELTVLLDAIKGQQKFPRAVFHEAINQLQLRQMFTDGFVRFRKHPDFLWLYEGVTGDNEPTWYPLHVLADGTLRMLELNAKAPVFPSELGEYIAQLRTTGAPESVRKATEVEQAKALAAQKQKSRQDTLLRQAGNRLKKLKR